MRDRAFTRPIKAVQHLSKLAELAGKMPSAIRAFTLDHKHLSTINYCGRKSNGHEKSCTLSRA